MEVIYIFRVFSYVANFFFYAVMVEPGFNWWYILPPGEQEREQHDQKQPKFVARTSHTNPSQDGHTHSERRITAVEIRD